MIRRSFCKNEHYTAQTFWVLADLNGFIFPEEIPTNLNFRPIIIPNLDLISSKYFIQKEAVPGDITSPKYLEYIGKKTKVFKVIGVATIQYDGFNKIELQLVLARGTNGQLPDELVYPIRKEGLLLPGSKVLETTVGLVCLNPGDTIMWFFNNTDTIEKNSLHVVNFNITLKSI